MLGERVRDKEVVNDCRGGGVPYLRTQKKVQTVNLSSRKQTPKRSYLRADGPRMLPLILILGLCLTLPAAHGKIFERCELASIMKRMELDGYTGYSLPNWVCTAYHESGFNTEAVNFNPGDKSKDYGIFQINSRRWCKDDRTPKSHNICRTPCSAFLQDNITQAVQCAKTVVSSQGMSAWVAWNTYCKDKDLSEWIKDCQL
ncbi:hypothetical protein NDU88_002551 [Pleurodeles waltl]|uniref:lysozyme n=1 Tax=Pleurodeles waltl TaxID=8319 RepID=A0AAV7SFF5_PLEWA|nr:hypothetical protein NDU88_002551 [Pleurodeles waltl]